MEGREKGNRTVYLSVIVVVLIRLLRIRPDEQTDPLLIKLNLQLQ